MDTYYELLISGDLLKLYTKQLFNVIQNDEKCVRYIITERIKEIATFFDNSITCESHKLKGLRFDKDDYINLKIQNTPYSPKIDFQCKGIGKLVNATSVFVMYGKLKGEKTNTVEIIEKLTFEDLNKLFKTCIKYI